MEARRIGPYQLLSHLGSGGMGNVWKARHVETGDLVAVKTVTPPEGDPRDLGRRFERERRIHQDLVHPNLVRTLDSGDLEDVRYLVLELVEGSSLSRILRTREPIEVEHLHPIGLALASGLNYLHEMQVVHRDLKPGNILFSTTGAVKIADFGLARDPESTDLTRSSQLIGTAAYISPEMIHGHAVGTASDLFALGLILYQMVTTRSPFEGDSVARIFHRIANEPAVPPGVLVPGLEPGLEKLIMSLLEKDPSARPTAFDCAARFREWAARIEGWQKGAEARGLMERYGRVLEEEAEALAPGPATGSPADPFRTTMKPGDKTPAGPVAPSVPAGAVPGTPAAANEDDVWMLKAGEGDLGAFDRLVEKHRRMAWKVAYAYFGAEDVAEDVVQNAFTRIFIHAKKYRPRGHFRAYLRQVVVRLCINRKKQDRHVDPSSGLDLLAAGQASPSMQVSRRERDAAVRAALGELSPRQRMVVTLRFFEHLRHREIAEALGIHEKAVEKLMGRARKILEDALENNVRKKGFSLP